MSVNTTRRRPLTAVVLSLIEPGLGHVYCGRIVKGLVLLSLSTLLVAVVMVMWGLSLGRSQQIVVGTALFASLVIWLVAVIDSYYLARHTRADYELKDYNHWAVYVLFMLISSGGGGVQMSLGIRSNYLEAFRVPTSNMYPTIHPGDRLLASKAAYRDTDPKRGDIVIFPDPNNRRVTFVSRVVALPGDRVAVKNGEVVINGKKLEHLPVREPQPPTSKHAAEGNVFYEINGQAKYQIMLSTETTEQSADVAELTIPKYHCFVISDNRNHSRDSRHFGAICLAGIKGRFDYLYWPVDDWKRVGPMADR